jgi:uncharacterized protein (DUF58 family)
MIIIFMGLVVFGLIALQNYVYNRLWDKGLSLDIRFSSKEAFEGDSLFLREELSNNKLLPLPWVFVKFNVSRNLVFESDQHKSISDAHYQSDLFSIMMYQSIRRKMFFVCTKRGYYRLRNITMACSNLLYNRRFDKHVENFTELTVFPKLLGGHDDINLIYKNLDATMLSNSLINPDPFEFRGIREYQPTDPMRDINFKATAVAQQLMVNIHAPTSSKRLEIVLNLEYNRPYPEFELYEQAIRLAATIAERYIGQGVKLGLYTNGKDALIGENVVVGAGEGASHMYKVFQALARISLSFKVGHISMYLNELKDDGESPVYLIISPYCEQDFLDAVEVMKNRGLSVFVVVPTQKGMDDNIGVAETDTMRIWEAL